MKRQNQQVHSLIKLCVVCLVILIAFLPLSAVSSHGDPVSPTLQTETANKVTQENVPILPEWAAPLESDFDHNHVAIFNRETRTTKLHSPYPVCKTCIAESTEYQKPYETPQPILTDTTLTDMTTSEVTQSPEMWPNAPTIRIIAVWPSGDTSACSGMLVEKAHLLTAAHCTFTHLPELCLGDKSCWVEDLEIYNDANPDDGQHTSFTNILTWTAWTENRDFNTDLAIVALSSPLGEKIGWLGFGYHNDPEGTFFPGADLESTSYPTQDPYNGETMCSWKGQFATITDEQFYASEASQEGQSGAASHNPGANHVIYGVLSHTLKIDDEVNSGYTRITSDKFFAMRDWINGAFKDLPLKHFLPFIIQ